MSLTKKQEVLAVFWDRTTSLSKIIDSTPSMITIVGDSFLDVLKPAIMDHARMTVQVSSHRIFVGHEGDAKIAFQTVSNWKKKLEEQGMDKKTLEILSEIEIILDPKNEIDLVALMKKESRQKHVI